MDGVPQAPGFWKDRTVLVTGATGFLGGWLVRELIDRQARVVAIVRRERPESQFQLQGHAERVAVVNGTVWDRELIGTVVARYGVDVIFHTAMSGGDVTATLASPVDCFRSTAESTLWMLDLLRRDHPETTLIVSSSDKAYGQQDVPYTETQALAPRHPQEVSKAAQDLLAQSFGKVYGVRTAVARCANFYGPFDFNFSRIVPYVARCAAEGRAPVLRSNGHSMRDFIHVQEAAWAHLDLAERVAGDTSVRGEAFNFSYGKGWTVLDLVNRILELAGTDLVPVIEDTARHEIPDMLLSSDKARAVLGWKPRLAFDESLRTTVRWYLDYCRHAAPPRRTAAT